MNTILCEDTMRVVLVYSVYSGVNSVMLHVRRVAASSVAVTVSGVVPSTHLRDIVLDETNEA